MSVSVQILMDADHPAQSTAATTEQFVVGRCPFSGTITSAAITGEAALTAAAGNFRTFTLFNRKQDGSGTTVVATLSTDLAGGNWVATDEKAMTLTAIAADLAVAADDQLEMVETVTGTGATHPQLKVEVRGTH